MSDMQITPNTNAIQVMATICSAAQEHVGDPEAWDHEDLWSYMTVPDYLISCFLAQNTVHGDNGVECNQVIDDLCQMPPKNAEWWTKRITTIVEDLGGLKPTGC